MEVTQAQWALIYAISLAAFLMVDGLWLIFVMKPLFTDMLGGMLRSPIQIAPAAIFYLFYVVGILFFAVAPALTTGNWFDAALRGAMLGLLAYGTYDMTNLATLQNYKLSIALLDTLWGGVVTGLTGTAGFFAARAVA